VLHKLGFPTVTVVAIECFIKEDKPTCIYCQTLDNLLPYIKEHTYYNTLAPSTLDKWGYYIDWTDPSTQQTRSIAIEFIHNENT